MSLGRRLPVILALLVCVPAGARGEVSGAGDDAVLSSLVRDALERSPEYARARAEVAAERERIPQAGALADPTLTLGIQNDGFRRIEIGTMETSFWQVMITQPLPWPGKRGRRESAARAQADAAAARLERIRLTTTADVERAYMDLLVARGQLELLGRLDVLWREAEAVARARYEVGAVPQSDVVRTQLERTRLLQQRIAIEASERTRVEALNRLRVHPLDEPIDTPRRLADAHEPDLVAIEEALAAAEARSPDLAEATLTVAAAERRVEAAERDRWPDFSVTAGIMPRGGIEPMWLASVGITLPVFSARGAAVAESSRRREAEERGIDSVRQVLQLRTRERHDTLEALVRTLKLYREVLLVQSDAAVRSTLSQYKVGKVTFASVLEVMRGVVADEGGFLETMAQAQRVAIAEREVSLEAAGGLGAGASGGTVPGSSRMAGGPKGASRRAEASAPAGSAGAPGMQSGM